MTEGMSVRDQTKLVGQIVSAIMPLLEGKPPEVQGAVLADLLAIFLAGHLDLDEIGADAKPNTDQIREELLTLHIERVRELTAINEKIILARWGSDAGRQKS
jgi:hypothetical protein